MSLILTTLGINYLMQVNDYRAHDPVSGSWYVSFGNVELTPGLPMYTDWNWPRSRGLGSVINAGGANFDQAALYYNFWTWRERVGGTQSRVEVSGTVQDGTTGLVVSGATVKLYDTPTGALLDTVTTDSLGNYTAGSPYSSNAFAVGYLSGAPDKAGTTVNTIPA